MVASVDNRVPTPASVAESHSQQALPDYPAAEPKTEHQDDQQDFEKRPDIKMEVWHHYWQNHLNYDVNYIMYILQNCVEFIFKS